MRSAVLWLVLFLALPCAAQTEVYRCEVNGRSVYTDKPCTPDAKPIELEPATIIQPTPGPDLAKQWDERVAREHRRNQRAAGNGESSEYAARKRKEKRIREARVSGRVVKGMSMRDVHDMRGEPDKTARDEGKSGDREKWTYTGDDGGTETVTFVNGEVSGVRTSRSKKKK